MIAPYYKARYRVEASFAKSNPDSVGEPEIVEDEHEEPDYAQANSILDILDEAMAKVKVEDRVAKYKFMADLSGLVNKHFAK